MNQSEILEAIKAERKRQDELWGFKRRLLNVWLTILCEEVGEVAKAILENDPKEHLEKELIQVAAVAVAWIERIDKKELEEIICIATH